MSKNYLSNSDREDNKYSRKFSYIQKPNISMATGKYTYFLLPEEYDIFSELDPSVFVKMDTEQNKWIALCLSYMRDKLMELYIAQNIVCVLPKLTSFKDEDGTMIFNWAYSNYRAFLSFDGESGNYDAYCGIVIQLTLDEVSTQTRKLNKKNYQAAIDSIIQLVVNNS